MSADIRSPREQSPDQREHDRVVTSLSGQLFVPAEDIYIDCEILNLSLGGAGIRCDEPPPLHTFVMLKIDGFGQYESVATRYIEGELGLRFICDEDRCHLLLKAVQGHALRHRSDTSDVAVRNPAKPGSADGG